LNIEIADKKYPEKFRNEIKKIKLFFFFNFLDTTRFECRNVRLPFLAAGYFGI